MSVTAVFQRSIPSDFPFSEGSPRLDQVLRHRSSELSTHVRHLLSQVTRVIINGPIRFLR
jgi:hypothetical protein